MCFTKRWLLVPSVFKDKLGLHALYKYYYINVLQLLKSTVLKCPVALSVNVVMIGLKIDYDWLKPT